MAAVAQLFLILLASFCLAGSGECPHGHYVKNAQCPPCPDRTYNTMTGYATSCADCSPRCWSNANTHIVSACNSTNDLRCECNEGFYATTPRSQCQSHTKCPPGYRIIRLGTPTSDFQCEPLPTLSPISVIPLTPRVDRTRTTPRVKQPRTTLPNKEERMDIPGVTLGNSNMKLLTGGVKPSFIIDTSTATSEVVDDSKLLGIIIVGGGINLLLVLGIAVIVLLFCGIVVALIYGIIICPKGSERIPPVPNPNMLHSAETGALNVNFTSSCNATDASLCASRSFSIDLRSDPSNRSIPEDQLDLIHDERPNNRV